MGGTTSSHRRAADRGSGLDLHAGPGGPAEVATSVVDGERRFVWGDAATCRLLGTSAERLEASRLGAFLDSEELEAELLAMHLLQRGDASYELEQRWPGPSGNGRQVLVRGSLLKLEGGTRRAAPNGLFVRQAVDISSTLDLTEGDRVSRPVRGSGHLPAALAEHAHPCGGEGDAPAKAAGPRHHAMVDGVDHVAEEVLELVASRNESQRVALAELELWAEQLERSNRDLSEFAYITAHDLRAPLAALAGNAELLARRSGSDLGDEGQRYLAAVLAKVGTMGRMIEDILAYCHAGNAGARPEAVDCTDVLAEVLEYLAPEIIEAKAYVSMQALGRVAGDRTQLVQLFQNVISNALKYRRPDGRARIDASVCSVGDDLVFSVADAGIGVPHEARADIFRMFHQLHQRNAPSGTGIGLAVCKRIVERHGGRIWIDDSQDGGLCVSFSLPAAEAG